VDRVPASYRSPPPGEPVHAASVDLQPYSDDRLRYHSLSGHDDSCCSSSSASDDEDLMTSSSPSHVMGVTSPSPPRQLSVCDLFTYQRPRQVHPRLTNVSTGLPAQHRSTVNLAVDHATKTDHVTLRYWTEPEIEDAEQRRAHRLPVSSLSFDDSAIDNQSAPSTSSGGSRVHCGGSRIDQSGLSTRSNGSCCHNGSNGGTSGHRLTRTVAVIQCSAGDVTEKLTSLQTVAALRQDESEEKRSRSLVSHSPMTSETNEVTV